MNSISFLRHLSANSTMKEKHYATATKCLTTYIRIPIILIKCMDEKLLGGVWRMSTTARFGPSLGLTKDICSFDIL